MKHLIRPLNAHVHAAAAFGVRGSAEDSFLQRLHDLNSCLTIVTFIYFEEIEGMVALTNSHDDTSVTSGLARASILCAHYLHKEAMHTLFCYSSCALSSAAHSCSPTLSRWPESFSE